MRKLWLATLAVLAGAVSAQATVLTFDPFQGCNEHNFGVLTCWVILGPADSPTKSAKARSSATSWPAAQQAVSGLLPQADSFCFFSFFLSLILSALWALRLDCSRISGLVAWSAWAPGHDGKSRAGCQSLTAASWARLVVGIALRRSDRCAFSAVCSEQPARKSSGVRRGSHRRVAALAPPHGPGDARELAGERDGGLVVAARLLALERPGAQTIRPELGALRVTEDRARPVDQQHAEIGIAALADATEPALQSRVTPTARPSACGIGW